MVAKFIHIYSAAIYSQIIHVKESLSQLSLSPSSDYDHLYIKDNDEEALCADEASKKMECQFLPLGKPDFSDLPSFAYQTCDGMVSIPTMYPSLHYNFLDKAFLIFISCIFTICDASLT